MRGAPAHLGPGEPQAVNTGDSRPVTCCRLRARRADFLVGGAARPRGHAVPPSSPQYLLRGSRPAPRDRAQPQRPPVYTDPRSQQRGPHTH
ncbi:hypothetical protein I79_025369 [Cricetulus griseus]|uniref:Uncharacterized protein n=1 Tax=Cricetulus griseus TaxID=10029 RepID=G3IN57_CRIGR|nr:hypothetical protein I79_025369 [Cricetulus griseus]